MADSELKIVFRSRLYAFIISLIKLIDKLPSDIVTRRISDQLIRSGTSVISNFTEAQSGYSKREFIRYFNISLRSSNESILWLEILRDSGHLGSANVSWHINELKEFSKIFARSIMTAKRRDATNK